MAVFLIGVLLWNQPVLADTDVGFLLCEFVSHQFRADSDVGTRKNLCDECRSGNISILLLFHSLFIPQDSVDLYVNN